MIRIWRRLAAWFALAAFAFSQLAVAAYACPKDTAALGPAQAVADEAPCAGFATPNLCEQHCDYGSASVATHADGIPAPDLALLPWGFALARADTAVVSTRLLRPCAQGGAPPPLARPTPLRI